MSRLVARLPPTIEVHPPSTACPFCHVESGEITSVFIDLDGRGIASMQGGCGHRWVGRCGPEGERAPEVPAFLPLALELPDPTAGG